ncbi:MAG: hypothetical protein IJD04_00105 [Desulfovibrionaceae bacterium]|nr:hypothetical protein [Desulfovibrionaceae bacterium]
MKRGITDDEVRSQRQKIISSSDFAKSKQLQNFLNYIIEAKLANNEHLLKGYTIGVECFSLGKDFDSTLSSLVRTEAIRLRNKLREYYHNHPDDPVLIEIPKGQYAPVFKRNSSAPHRAFSIPNSKNYQISILLLPFTNLNMQTESDIFLSGIYEELSAGFTHFPDLAVITPSYIQRMDQSGKQDISSLAIETDAKFILSGSGYMEKNACKLFITLKNAHTYTNVWSDKFVGIADDREALFKLQEDMGKNIIFQLAGELGIIYHVLRSKSDVSDKLLDNVFIGYAHWVRNPTSDTQRHMLHLLEEALKIDPANASLIAMQADLYATDFQRAFDNIENALDRSLELAEQASKINKYLQLPYEVLASNYFLRGNVKEFKNNLELAIRVNSFSSSVIASLSSWCSLLGLWDEMESLMKKVTDLPGLIPDWQNNILCYYHYQKGNYTQALNLSKKKGEFNSFLMPIVHLASSGMLDDSEECEQAAKKVNKYFHYLGNRWTIILERSFPERSHREHLEQGLKIT